MGTTNSHTSLDTYMAANPAIAHATGGINDTRGDAWGTQEVGQGGWLNGAGVPIYSNGPLGPGGPSPDTLNYINNISGVSTQTGIEWQCVELVNRLYLDYGWITSRWVGNGTDLFGNAGTVGLSAQANGSITYLQVGDVIGMSDGPGNPGHAGIVNSISGTSVQMASQNTETVFDSSFTYSGSSLSKVGWSGYTIQGVIHAPAQGQGTGAWSPGVVRPDGAGWHWYERNENSGGTSDGDFIYGVNATDRVITGDWNKDGAFTPGVVRKDGAGWHWYLKNTQSGGSADIDFSFGVYATDTPIVGDWDGDGVWTVGVVRKDGAGWHWYLRNYNSAGPANVDFSFGVYSTDTPIVGHWDGSGMKTTIGVVRQDGAGLHWYLRDLNSAGPATADFIYGLSATDTPVVGDWDGDGDSNPGVIRVDGAGLHWYERDYNSGGSATTNFIYGLSATDSAIPGNWDAM